MTRTPSADSVENAVRAPAAAAVDGQTASNRHYIPIRFVQVLAGALLCALVLRAFSYNVTGLDWDESLYMVMAQRWLSGDLPYISIWDQHPPDCRRSLRWRSG